MPKAKLLELAFEWLEAGVAERKQDATRYAASRIPSDTTYDPKAWRQLLLAEANDRWSAQQYRVAVDLLRWIELRWPDTPVALQATERAADWSQHPEYVADASRLASKRQDPDLQIDRRSALITRPTRAQSTLCWMACRPCWQMIPTVISIR